MPALVRRRPGFSGADISGKAFVIPGGYGWGKPRPSPAHENS